VLRDCLGGGDGWGANGRVGRLTYFVVGISLGAAIRV
jgi:hypothetical protein